MKEAKRLFASMGKAQCGDITCKVLIDHEQKKVITEPQELSWKQGHLTYILGKDNYNVRVFRVPYIQEEILLNNEYHHEVRKFTNEEKQLFD